MADKSKIVIIKKVKKGHAAHHGGSWKVAYADFVTAMMAFFLLMWLLAMVAPEKRAAVSKYFKEFNLFQESKSQSGTSFMQEASQILSQSGGNAPSTSPGFGKGGQELAAEALKAKLKKEIEEKLKALKDQAIVDVIEGGVRVQLVDMEGRSMFHSGSAQMTERAREILKLVSENIRDLPNRIAIEGHTDAAPLKAGQTTNWELSTQRASMARRELEAEGIDSGRVARVVGYADTELFDKDDPQDPRNRRISIILLQPKEGETAQAAPPAPAPAPLPVTPAQQIQPVQQGQPVQPPVQQKAPLPSPQPSSITRRPAPPAAAPGASATPAAPATSASRKPEQPRQHLPAREGGIIEREIGIKQPAIEMKKPTIAPDLGAKKNR